MDFRDKAKKAAETHVVKLILLTVLGVTVMAIAIVTLANPYPTTTEKVQIKLYKAAISVTQSN